MSNFKYASLKLTRVTVVHTTCTLQVKKVKLRLLRKFQLRDDFQESVEMSTYLVAFVVCDFKRVSELTKRNISVSVYAAEAMLPQAKYAVTTAARTMDYFESFFGVHYPLPKQGRHYCLYSRKHYLQVP